MAGVLARMEHMKNVNFLIAGDGPKRTLLEGIRERRNMQDRVTLLGALDHSKVNQILNPMNLGVSDETIQWIFRSAKCYVKDTFS